MPLFQAGASESGRNLLLLLQMQFLAATPDVESGIELRQDLRRRAATAWPEARCYTRITWIIFLYR
ncbi:Nitrilotriacetate monooxygenase component A [Bacillus thuringiensis serovar israelensis ATCC 35646]|nr:Nitrilotriacetate monooxygenase component A [Bacillus thuringiensis serovar israelensis ATCC 35646]